VPFAANIFVHSAVRCESERIGARSRILAFAHVVKEAVTGRYCNIATCFHRSRSSERQPRQRQEPSDDGAEIGDDVFIGGPALPAMQ